jgi:trk system potassium uptake protein TrkA
MNMIVIGCGRLGSDLAYRLFLRGHKVSVVDQEEHAFSNLPADFRGRTLEGEAMNQNLLRRAGIESADGVAVVTNSDTVNAIVGHLARTLYNVPYVVVRNFDPRYRPIHETFNLQAISSSTWGAQRIEEMLYSNEVRTVFSAGNGEVEIYEFTVPESWHGHSLQEFLPTQGCSATAITRAGRALLPEKDLLLQKGDVVLIGATLEGASELRQNINSEREV